MTLEDHLGDILRKARQASQVSPADAARAARLTEADLATLEDSGRCGRRPAFHSLAPLLGLHAARLEAIADGWLPLQPDLDSWRELRLLSTSRDAHTAHAYLVWDEASREAALFDTGWDATPVLRIVEENHLALKHLFLTHTHDDHLAGLEPLRHAFPALRLHTNSPSAPPQHRNRPHDCVHLGSLRISHRDTPGHAPDGVVYIVGNWPDDAPHAAFIGDTLFAGSLAAGFVSMEDLRRSVREQILTLPADTLLCPGHGPLTTVAEEKIHNPFFAA